MFDTLTRDDLYAYHSQLNTEGERLHKRFMALHSPLSEEAGILMAECAQISETMNAVYAEIDRRNAEVLPHDEGTSYCTSIPGKCPVHDA